MVKATGLLLQPLRECEMDAFCNLGPPCLAKEPPQTPHALWLSIAGTESEEAAGASKGGKPPEGQGRNAKKEAEYQLQKRESGGISNETISDMVSQLSSGDEGVSRLATAMEAGNTLQKEMQDRTVQENQLLRASAILEKHASGECHFMTKENLDLLKKKVQDLEMSLAGL